MKEPTIELRDGNYEIKPFADKCFEEWLECQPLLNIKDEEIRKIFDVGFMTCRMFFEEAVIPELIKGIDR